MKSVVVYTICAYSLFLNAWNSFAGDTIVPIYDMFEIAIENNKNYENPFADVELKSVFTSPSGRLIHFFGFHDGDGDGGQIGSIWKQRFMPDELGTWFYEISFDDGTVRIKGKFVCVIEGGKPGPWRQNPSNPHWIMTGSGENFLPITALANVILTPIDWQDMINWMSIKGNNTLITGTINTKTWGEGWPNVTPFLSLAESNKEYKAKQVWYKWALLKVQSIFKSKRVVDYDYFNIRMWNEWDEMLRSAGAANIYIGPFDGPAGDYGGSSGIGTVVPPKGLEYYPPKNTRFDSPFNLRMIKYMVARQAAFWNLAYWNLYSTEIFDIKTKDEIIQYGEFLASITSFGRMITAQDIEQDGRKWLSEMEFPKSRKLNTIQAGTIADNAFQEAKPNNALAIKTYHNFPVLVTEGLWEGQNRANKPLRMIWGSTMGALHPVWADWSYDDGVDGGRWGSIGKGWSPLKPLSEHVFGTNQLGANTEGDEQLAIAGNLLKQLRYWEMVPHNELVVAGAEAYCLANPGFQYVVYAPNGGDIEINLINAVGKFKCKWLNPKDGIFRNEFEIDGGAAQVLSAPDRMDWVLILTAARRHSLTN